VLTGLANSSAALAVQEIAAEEGIVFGNQAGADPITKSRCNEYTFRYELRTGQIARARRPCGPSRTRDEGLVPRRGLRVR